ncbi:conserved hypothetical protein [Bradyrhizobium sp. STM 3843]|uniref:DUF882 domain-containing protein n=1 Tax=Bradyrhizobium sp. STM 3843 TaxID=551947 RepID=UPI0002404704|nr:DUF882 domain-containing protein [Bradyrhizobium sp. STM 3843]CCE11651.1 conserved hypothetical protein [Bradyrhizobium sp. STM 3843]
MLSGFVRQLHSLPQFAGKAGCQIGLASLLLLGAAGSVHDAAALNETRTLSFHHTHSDEDLTITFKRDGRYDEDALKKLNHYLRDWRTQDETVMDRHLFDILWEVYRDVDGKQPIQIVSSYRSPGTNAMLRRRSAHSGVARHSQHMLGHAMDFYIPGVPLEQIRYAGLRLQRGGVGFYPTSGSPFVHLDTGNIRHWPRMNHDQLVKVFPDGRTVHIPSDGVPLKGYELARAEIEKRGDGDGATTGKPTLLARLFRGKPADDDEEGASEADAKPVHVAAVVAARATTDGKTSPRGKLANALQLASADSQLVQTIKAQPAPTAEAQAAPGQAAPQSVSDIINARGFWGDDPANPKQATPEQVAAITARRAADPQATASVMNAMAFAPPASSPVDRSHIVAASAPIPVRNTRSQARNAETNTVAASGAQAKGAQGQDSPVTTATRISAAKENNSSWMRIMLLAPSASTSMSVTMLGDPDLTLMRTYFVKPQLVLAMSFAEDPAPGLSYDQFSGSATVKLETKSFVLRAASLR